MDHYLVSARKYRPSTFDSVVGQRALTMTLKNAIASRRLAHSYLFCGSRGVGKTSCARIFAKTINCSNPTPDGEACNECDSCRSFNAGNSMNIIELDAASNNGVDDIKDLIEQTQVPPTDGRYRVFIVDEVHMLTSAAFNAFLKTLEEPPSYVVFILATTEKHKILPTILSRCQIYDFNRITTADMIEHLGYVAQTEGFTADPAALRVIAQKADGAMRDALSIFDQVAASTRGNITYQATIENLNVLDYNYYNQLLDTFLGNRPMDAWLIYKEIRDKGFDSHFFINGLASFMRDLMVAYDPRSLQLIDGDDQMKQAMAAAAKKCTPDFLYRALCLLNDADLNYRVASNKQFLVELTLAKICQSAGPSPSNSGHGEGQLKPIERPAGAPQAPTSPVQAAQPGATAQQPQAPPATPQAPPAAARPMTPPASVPRPAAGPTAGKKVAGVMNSISIKSHGTPPPQQAPGSAAQQPAAASASTPPAGRQNPYTIDALRVAWHRYAELNPTQHIIINTMRASLPVPTEGDRFTVTVENAMQRDTMLQHLPAITTLVHDMLLNDNIAFTIDINQGESAPHTWNEHKLLDYMKQKRPALAGIISTLNLKL